MIVKVFKMKKVLATLLAMLLLLTVIPLGAVSVSALTSGKFTYTVSGGKATITDCDTSVWGALIIPSTIYGYPVVAIGDYAFSNCTKLTSVTIPDSVTTIGNDAFHWCDSMASVTIPDTVTSIGDDAFSGCYDLSSVTIPAGVTSIGEGVFGYCTKLTAITVDKANTKYCDVDGVVLSKDRTELVAFPTGRTGSYTVPSGVTTIKRGSFSGANITSVTISSGVTTVESFAFSGSDLTSVTISKSVKTIGYHAFYLCDELATVYYTGSSSDRSKMTIDSSNTELTGAKWQYNAHSYSSVCDTTCDECSATRVAPHDYVATCDPVCDECGKTRQVSADAHVYKNACDADCNQCGWIREVSADVHTYTNACDASCNTCGAVRETSAHTYVPEVTKEATCGVAGTITHTCTVCGYVYEETIPATGNHVYENACDGYCVACGRSRTAPHVLSGRCDPYCNYCGQETYTYVKHTYDNDHDPSCNVCGTWRSVSTHEYDNDCDSDCNGCGEMREAPHAYSDVCDTDCNTCGLRREAPHAFDNPCDEECGVCGMFRDVPKHEYNHPHDDNCNACGFTRQVPDHVYSGEDDPFCDVCGTMRSVETADNIIASSESGFKWKLYRDGLLVVESYDVPKRAAETYLSEYIHLIKKIDFYYGSTTIGACAFANCTALVSADLSAVKTIGEYAFSGCTALTRVMMTDVTVGNYAFSSCTSLEMVTFVEDTLGNTLNRTVFDGCTALHSIYVYPGRYVQSYSMKNPVSMTVQSDSFKGVTATVYYPPYKCTSYWLDQVVAGSYGGNMTVAPSWSVPMGVDAFAYYDEATQTLTIRGTGRLLSVSSGACTWWYWHRDRIKHLVVEDGITRIWAYTFEYYDYLETVRLPNTLTYLNCNAFNDCVKLTSLVIPASVMGTFHGFHRCSSLKDLYYMGTDKDWEKVSVSTSYTQKGDVTMYGETLHFLEYVPEQKSCTEVGNEGYYVFADGFGMFDSQKQPIDSVPVIPALGHAYDNACDAICNTCGDLREVEPHVYDHACDTTCNVCGAVREVGDHVYDYTCDATCNECGAVRDAEHVYFTDCDRVCEICGEETRVVNHKIQHVSAVAATCVENGNIEYWYCTVCGYAWLDAKCTLNTNLRAVILPAIGEHTYDNACDAACNVCGDEREVGDHVYDYDCDKTCNVCGALRDADHVYPTACDRVCEICGEETRVVNHAVLHVSAVAATCVENGNIEYWYCTVCGYAWLDAECTLNTNPRAVILPATGEHTYDNACDAACNVCGGEREVGDHVYDYDCDKTCNVCGALRDADHVYPTACDRVCEICGEETRVVNHTVLHVSDEAATCVENGNIEYWYCPACSMIWADEACTMVTSWMAVIIPATGEHTYDNACDAACNVCGDEREVGDHVYSNGQDATCNECGHVRIAIGDVNADGRINNHDLARLIQYVNEWEVTVDRTAADMDGNGRINNFDIGWLCRYLNGWDIDPN